jgi:hypothetical protein
MSHPLGASFLLLFGIRRGDENQSFFHLLICSDKMPCTRSGWQSNRSNSVFRNYTEQTNCLNGSLEASSPETDDPLSMTAAIPSNPDPHEEERAPESKMLRLLTAQNCLQMQQLQPMTIGTDTPRLESNQSFRPKRIVPTLLPSTINTEK